MTSTDKNKEYYKMIMTDKDRGARNLTDNMSVSGHIVKIGHNITMIIDQERIGILKEDDNNVAFHKDHQ